MDKTITILAEHSGKRLDTFLSETMVETSRAKIQKSIKDGSILLNGKQVKPNKKVAEKDTVTISTDLTPPDPEAPLVPRADIPLDVLHHDDDIIIVNKQNGLIVHPDRPEETNTLANALISHFPEIANVGEGLERPGIMHRLDKDASGIMVIGRNQKAYENLKAQFRDRTVDKRYTVLIHGKPPDEEEGVVSFPIGRLKGTGKMAAHPTMKEGYREAVSRYTVIENYMHATLVEVKTETGRTHQVRVHMKAIGAPVVGDSIYTIKGTKTIACGRLFLHAQKITFTHPGTGELITFEAPLPDELKKVLRKLKQ